MQQCRFASSVGAHQRCQRTGFQRKADVVDHGSAVEVEAERVGCEQRFAR